MAYDPTQGSGNGVGSGNPYAGSGWTNFDRFLQQENLDWGASQPDYNYGGNQFDSGVNYDNWLIQAGHPDWEWGTNAPPEEPAPPPGEGTVDTTPTPESEPTAWDKYMAQLDAWDASNPQDTARRPGQPVQPRGPKPKPPPGYDAQGNPISTEPLRESALNTGTRTNNPKQGNRNTNAW
jgi:hypothetical protein